MSRLRVAVIGAGAWGRNHVRTVASMPEAELTVVCDLDPQRREQMGRQYPGILLTDDPAVAMGAADAVIVASSAMSHEPLAMMAIERRLPVLVEKPFTLSVATAERVAQAAQAAGVPVVVGHLLLFHPAIERLRAMISGGELGDVYYLYSQRVNLGQVRPDESALWSFGPHDIAVALYLIGEAPVQVSAQGHSYLQPGIEDVVF
ncbi:MAG: Gfo/Idh/MocA family oxidoreductase, partial [Gemmatimonadales bacterium]